jgi:beta-N-acetylhexosaminidase
VDGHAPSAALSAFLREADPFGVILFARHLHEAGQVRELNACIRESTPFSPLVALDQEGGRVSRLAKLGHAFPGASDLGGNADAARSLALEMGGALRDLGFQVDFAPVADLGPAAVGTGLEGRLYGEDPETVTRCCRAFLDGLAEAGVEGCLKHFPGLGGSTVDSHRSLPRIPGSPSGREAHLAPYRALALETPFVMTAHAAYDGSEEAPPSSLDPGIYALLADLGFAGTAVTDDLKMGAVAARAATGELAAQALRAGANVALWVSPEEESLRAVEFLRRAAQTLVMGAKIPYLGGERESRR